MKRVLGWRNDLRLAARAALLVLCLALPAQPALAQAPEPGGPAAASYIIVFKPGAVQNVLAVAQEHARRYGVNLTHVYEHALNGYAGTLNAGLVRAIQNDPRVAYVEADGVMSADGTQSNATWGLDRIDQRNLPLSTTYSYSDTGAGVTAYIIDTGILFGHTEFGGRASAGYDAVTPGGSATDCNGHGTHVAGTVGGATYGVAKEVKLVAVRVLGCNGSGSTSGVIAGIDWVTANHSGPAVANMSLGGSASSALDTAVANSIGSGVTYAIAAGNGNFIGIAQDACKYSPARVATAITVSATDNTDKKASWANYGSCVDIFAPGVGITSSWYTSTTATNTISGTSMATPHVAGVAALYLQVNPGASPSTVASALSANATAGVVKSPGKGSANRLLFTNY